MCLRFLPGAEEYYKLRGGPVFERNADQVNSWLGRLLTHLNGGHRILLWSVPERQESLTRGLVAADVITTSWAELVGPLAQRFAKTVIHLPDTHPGATKAFRKAWNRQVIPAMRRAQEERRGRG